ncbi:MAG: alpha-galactosidase [Planctomycetes bacterium]|nr:alpha-galactosidase [Planctomycetota bacterium]
MTDVKIAIVGAGSASFGPGTVRDVLLSEPLKERSVELALMDIADESLERAVEFARWLKEKLGHDAQISATTDLRTALDGADYVVAAIEVKRALYWSMDFHVPRWYGSSQVYGENGGPGGIFHALRNMGPMVRIAKTMEDVCPQGVLLNYTNPESKLCEAITRLSGIKAVGLCHGIHEGISHAARVLGMESEELEVKACGINHFTWFQEIKDKRTGEDLYPRLRQRDREGDLLSDWHNIGMDRILLRRFGLWPSPAPNHYGEYVRWASEFVCAEVQYFYDPADGHPWETGNIPHFIYSLGGEPTNCPLEGPTQKPSSPKEAPMKPTGELGVPIMEALTCGEKRRLPAINVPNQGTIPNLPEDMVVEAPAEADADGLRTVPCEPLPEGIAALLRVQGSIHKLLVEAFAEKSRDKLIQAVLLDPTIDSYRNAIAMVDEMLRLQADILPELS